MSESMAEVLSVFILDEVMSVLVEDMVNSVLLDEVVHVATKKRADLEK